MRHSALLLSGKRDKGIKVSTVTAKTVLTTNGDWYVAPFPKVTKGSTNISLSLFRLARNVKQGIAYCYTAYRYSDSPAICYVAAYVDRNDDLYVVAVPVKGDTETWEQQVLPSTITKMLSNVKEVIAGDGCLLAMDKSNNLWGLGENTGGKLGQGDATYVTSFVKLANDVKSYKQGEAGLVVLTNAGDLYCAQNDTIDLVSSNVTDFNVDSSCRSVVYHTSDGGFYANGSATDIFGIGVIGTVQNIKLPNNVISHNIFKGWSTYILTDTGDLYLSGNNNNYQLGTGDTTTVERFTKRASNVKKVVTDGYKYTYYLTNSGELYVAGNKPNGLGEDSNGRNIVAKTFTKLTGNVKDITSFNFGDHITYLTNDKNLYALHFWTDNTFVFVTSNIEEIGSSETILLSKDGKLKVAQYKTKTSIIDELDNVDKAGGDTAVTWAITKNKELYLRGSNIEGIQGSGDTASVTKFTKRADNVAWFSGELRDPYRHSYYITTQKELFISGANEYGQLGLGHTHGTYTFAKCLDNVDEAIVGDYTAHALCGNELYVWGHGCSVSGSEPITTPTLLCTTSKENLMQTDPTESDSGGCLALTESGEMFAWGASGYLSNGLSVRLGPAGPVFPKNNRQAVNVKIDDSMYANTVISVGESVLYDSTDGVGGVANFSVIQGETIHIDTTVEDFEPYLEIYGKANSTDLHPWPSGSLPAKAVLDIEVMQPLDLRIIGSHYCFSADTEVLMADGSVKPVQDLTYEDELLVWDFDNGCFAKAKALWITKPRKADHYYRLKFSDGTELRLVGSDGKCHRLLNIENGEFTYGSHFHVGQHTFKEDGSNPRLVSIELVEEEVEYYNVVTHYHMNCFANGILSSTGYNNMYPIKDMKFVKDNRELIPFENYVDVPRQFYDSLRLGEQDLSKRSIEKAKNYVGRMLKVMR